jgi:hypothetical protein
VFLSALKTTGTFVSMRALWLIRISDVAAAHDEPKTTRKKWGCDTYIAKVREGISRSFCMLYKEKRKYNSKLHHSKTVNEKVAS